MNIVKNNNKVSTLINLQNNTDVISQYGCNGNTHVHHVDPMYVYMFTCLLIDRIDIKMISLNIHVSRSKVMSVYRTSSN